MASNEASRPVPKGFFAYPGSPPSLAEAIRTATPKLNAAHTVEIHTWEECKTGGKIVIEEICRQINSSDLFMADLTALNANVMFELGYAIGRNKRIWLVIDTSYEKQKTLFEQLRILTTVGYEACSNSEDIISHFYKDNPVNDLGSTIFEQSIQPNLKPSDPEALLYLKSKHDNEASIQMTKVISKASCPIITDDPRESTVQNLTWYGSRLFRALGMVCHLTAPNREGADLQTARYALVAGMAFGFDKPLLMLSEGNILTPIDYRDLLKSYSTATEAIAHVQKWVDPIVDNYQSEAAPKGDHLAPAKLATDLQSLRFGEYVAEDEAETLIERYFLPTAEYQAALDGVQTLFVGRRGTGKTANLLKLEDDLSRDRRNLVCVIKPVAYEMQGIVSLLRTYRQQDTKGFAIESLWKFLLITEIASAAASRIREKLDQAIQPKERDFIKFIDDNQALILSDFSVRLERCVKTLMAAGSADSADVQSARLAISESLHAGILQHLRSELGDILSPIERVVILVDNLDKAWDKQSDIEVMSEVLLGLIGTATRIPQDFSRTDSRRQRVRISLTIFLRSDIFHQVKRIAREPDKLRFAKLQWHDRSLLLRVLEERFVASFEGNIDASELWNRYFCRLVRGKPTKDYIIGTVLDRPRDLIYFVNAAVSIAVNRKHGFINEQDLIDAEKQYSQYAFESIIVENTLRGLDLEAALIEFAGAPCVLGANQIAVLLKSVDLSKDGVGELVELLCSLTFFGLEVDKDRFVFSDDPQEHKRNQVQARRYAHSKNSEPRYSIHPAFRAFLEIE